MGKDKDYIFIKADPGFHTRLKLESGVRGKSMKDITKDFASDDSLWNIKYDYLKNQKTVDVSGVPGKKPIRVKIF